MIGDKEDARRRAAYALGLSDRESANRLGLNVRVYQSWRLSRGLPANRKSFKELRDAYVWGLVRENRELRRLLRVARDTLDMALGREPLEIPELLFPEPTKAVPDAQAAAVAVEASP